MIKWRNILASLIFFSSLSGVIAYFSYNVFTSIPFIQQELIGIGFWFNYERVGFWETIFDPIKMDSHVGRFRYIEYLWEAIYWKMVAGGWFPRDIFDYSAYLAILICALLIGLILKNRKLNLVGIFAILSLLLLSNHSYMLVVWHYRKAKFIVSILLLLLFYCTEHPNLKQNTKQLLTTLCIGLGYLTDPYFIVICPFLVLTYDVCRTPKTWFLTRSWVRGSLIGIALIVILNGIIGPSVNPLSALVFTHIPDKPEHLLNPENIKYFYKILPDMIGPLATLFDGALCFYFASICFTLLAVWYLYKKPSNLPLLWCFLLSLPLCAYLVQPNHRLGIYSSYYGHPLFIIFLLALSEILVLSNQLPSKFFRTIPFLMIGCMIWVHQSNYSKVLYKWSVDHMESLETRQKYFHDYVLLKNIQKHFNNNIPFPYVLNLDYENFTAVQFTAVYEKETKASDKHMSERQHTLLAYLHIPLIFHKERLEGRLLIETPQESRKEGDLSWKHKKKNLSNQS